MRVERSMHGTWHLGRLQSAGYVVLSIVGHGVDRGGSVVMPVLTNGGVVVVGCSVVTPVLTDVGQAGIVVGRVVTDGLVVVDAQV